MKYKVEVIIIIVILTLVTSLELITSNITTNAINECFSKIEVIKKDLKNEKYNNENVDNLDSFWNEEKNKMSYYIEHDELEKVGNILARLKENVSNKEQEEALENIEEVKFLFGHIKDKGCTKLQNIF